MFYRMESRYEATKLLTRYGISQIRFQKGMRLQSLAVFYRKSPNANWILE